MAVTPADIAVELGRTAPEHATPTYLQWETWIARAERLVRARYEDDYFTTLDPGLVDDVVAQAVAEHVRAWTPDNVRRKDVSVDDGRVGVDYYATVGPLTIPDHLWASLGPVVAGDVFSIRMTGAPDTTPCPEPWI